MADYWLDLARFSETDGFLDDHHDRLLWPWRDWVIDSFARNRPFDEFAHVAARRRPAAERDARADPRDGVPARRQAHDRERRDRRRVQGRVHGRAHRQRARHRVPGAHGRLRALPRPQVRSDQADRLLLARRVLQQQRRAGRYAPGFSGIQGGPTLPWPDEATAAALRDAAAEVDARKPTTMPPRSAAAASRRAPQRRAWRATSRARGRAHPRGARRRARRPLRVRIGAARAARGPAAAAPAAHPAAGADRVPAQSVLRAAAAADRDGRAAPAARGVRARGPRAAQLQRRVA